MAWPRLATTTWWWGEGGHNLLVGASHNDTLVGGSNVDYILGDACILPDYRSPQSGGNAWSVTHDANGYTFNNCGVAFGWTVRDLDGVDRIFAGAGNDVIYAGGMDDIVDGGMDDDYIAAGDDLYVNARSIKDESMFHSTRGVENRY